MPKILSFQDYDAQPAEFVDLDPRLVISAAPVSPNCTEVHWHPPGEASQTRMLYLSFGQFCELVSLRTGRGVAFETDDAPVKRVERYLPATGELPF
jgi:hypothetical protein